MKLISILFLASLPFRLTAQEPAHEKAKAEGEESRFPEIEFVASDIFRSGTYIQPVWKELHLEGHYFGGKETDVGHIGGSWLFRWKGLGLAPGLGVTFGTNQYTTSPAFSFRWDYKKKWFVTQGLIIQGFRDTPILEEGDEEEPSHGEPRMVRPVISDGNHASVRWKRLMVGATLEHIQFREGDEWKTGGRLAIRLARHVSAILYVLTPGKTEFRGGILLHPAEE